MIVIVVAFVLAAVFLSPGGYSIVDTERPAAPLPRRTRRSFSASHVL